jgi:small-conductance mechanosensitive channel
MQADTGLTLQKIETIVQGFFWMLPNLGIAAVVLVLFLIAAWAARFAVTRVFRRRKRRDLGDLLGGFAKWALVALGLLVVATIVFPSIKPSDVLATLGIGSIAVGFAFKDILQNWIAGLLLLVRQPFRQGDQIRVGEFEGTVEHIEARATLIKTYDGRRVIIPNSDVYTRALTVNTAYPKRRSQYEVGIGYGDDIDRAAGIMLDAIRGLEGVEGDPAPDVVPWELSGSSVNLRLRWWTESRRATVVATRGRVIAAVRKALGEAGIDLPYPTRTVLLHDQTEDADGDRARQREGWPADGRSAPRPPDEARNARREAGQGEPAPEGQPEAPRRRRSLPG